MHQPVLCGWVGSGAYKLGERVLSILVVKIIVAFYERNLYFSQNPCTQPTTLTQTYYQAKMRWWRCCKSSPSILEYKLNGSSINFQLCNESFPQLNKIGTSKNWCQAKTWCHAKTWYEMLWGNLACLHNGPGQAWRAWFLDSWKMELNDWSRVMQNGTAIKRQKHTK